MDGDYLKAWNERSRRATWAKGQKTAKRFARLSDARAVASKWCTPSPVKIIRLRPRKR